MTESMTKHESRLAYVLNDKSDEFIRRLLNVERWIQNHTNPAIRRVTVLPIPLLRV